MHYAIVAGVQSPPITFVPVPEEELPDFILRVQESFSVAVREEFGTDSPIPSAAIIRRSYSAPGAETYHLVREGQRIGGVILSINRQIRHNEPEIFFLSPQLCGHGWELEAWLAIEQRYPDTPVWETGTPYFEERNIHFYLNKCGFRIVEFYNKHHPAPDMPEGEDEDPDDNCGFFRFEKLMSPQH